jgi:hypothetical protein
VQVLLTAIASGVASSSSTRCSACGAAATSPTSDALAAPAVVALVAVALVVLPTAEERNAGGIGLKQLRNPVSRTFA